MSNISIASTSSSFLEFCDDKTVQNVITHLFSHFCYNPGYPPIVLRSAGMLCGDKGVGSDNQVMNNEGKEQ